MIKTVRVIVVNPAERTVEEHQWEHNATDTGQAQLYKWIGTTLLDHTTTKRLSNGHMITAFVDDIGLSKPHLKGWFLPILYHSALRGTGVIIGADKEGETIDCPWDAKFVRANILWGG